MPEGGGAADGGGRGAVSGDSTEIVKVEDGDAVFVESETRTRKSVFCF